MSKRGNGEGTVYRRKDGRWAAELTVDGKRVTVYGKTKRETVSKLHKLRNERDAGTLSTSPKMLLKELVIRWLNYKRPRVKETTYITYERYLRVHVTPRMGEVTLRNLGTEHVRSLHTTLLNNSKGPQTVVHAHRVLRAMLGDAQKWDLVVRNVASLVKPPRLPEARDNILSEEELRRLLDAADGENEKGLIGMALSTAMRSGEILALRWEDIDLDKRILTVNHTISFKNARHYSLGDPKTKSSRRSIKFGEGLHRRLVDLRSFNTAKAETAGSLWQDLDFVFSDDFGWPLQPGNMPRKFLYPVLERAGLKRVWFHDLRHTAISHMLGNGVSPTDVTAIAGHSSVAFTLSRYAHALPGATERATGKMEELMQDVF